MNQPNTKIFQTTDFYLAAFLLTAGFSLISVNRDKPQRYSFVFERDEAVIEAANNYMFRHAQVEPASYVESIRALKQIIHARDYG